MSRHLGIICLRWLPIFRSPMAMSYMRLQIAFPIGTIFTETTTKLFHFATFITQMIVQRCSQFVRFHTIWTFKMRFLQFFIITTIRVFFNPVVDCVWNEKRKIVQVNSWLFVFSLIDNLWMKIGVKEEKK